MCSMKKSVSINFAKEALAQVFPYEFCKIPKNTLFTEHLWTTASDNSYFRRDSIFHKTRVKTRGKTKVLQEKELNRLAHTNYRGYYFEKNRWFSKLF